jgi:hypothetical protein
MSSAAGVCTECGRRGERRVHAQGRACKEPPAFAEDPAALNFWPVGPRAVYGPGAGAAALRARLWNSDPTGQQARRASALCEAALATCCARSDGAAGGGPVRLGQAQELAAACDACAHSSQPGLT